MNDKSEAQFDDLSEPTAGIVIAYVSNNSVPVSGLLDLIASVHKGLTDLRTQSEPAQVEVEKPTIAQIRKSISRDGIMSFIDGKTYKTLKRHLTGAGLDPASYRTLYGLPAAYPMTAPSYSEQRSALAKTLGLGQKRRTSREAAEKTPDTGPEEAKNPPGRPRKAAKANTA